MQSAQSPIVSKRVPKQMRKARQVSKERRFRDISINPDDVNPKQAQAYKAPIELD